MLANKIQALVNAIEAQRSQQAAPLIGERDMIAVLIMDLLLEYNTEVMLIKLDNKFKFENAVELLRLWEQHLKINKTIPILIDIQNVSLHAKVSENV